MPQWRPAGRLVNRKVITELTVPHGLRKEPGRMSTEGSGHSRSLEVRGNLGGLPDVRSW